MNPTFNVEITMLKAQMSSLQSIQKNEFFDNQIWKSL